MNDFLRFLFWDKMLIIVFVIFAIFMIVGILYVNSQGIRIAIRRTVLKSILRLETWAKWFDDDEDFDASWMDAEAWRKTRMR